MKMPEKAPPLPISAERLVPHRPPMLLIGRLVDFEGDSGVAEAELRTGNPLLDEKNGLDRCAAMEMIAQAYAAVKGYDDLLNGRGVKGGYLVGVRKMYFHGNCGEGDVLRIHVAMVNNLGHFSTAGGEVFREGALIAEGVVKVWTP